MFVVPVARRDKACPPQILVEHVHPGFDAVDGHRFTHEQGPIRVVRNEPFVAVQRREHVEPFELEQVDNHTLTVTLDDARVRPKIVQGETMKLSCAEECCMRSMS